MIYNIWCSCKVAW